jgi:pimeloyl-ACP methyl ester carboxylesterase
MKKTVLALAILGSMFTSVAYAAVKSVVVVHGAFADGSGWKPVTEVLEHDGYSVYVVQEPLTSLDADVAATRIALDRSGPAVLVGHSWGGMVITEAGSHPAARSLVYVAAFEPDVGESALALQTKTPPAAQSIGPVGSGFLQIKPESFHQDFAADVPDNVAHFAALSQVSIAADSFAYTAKTTAWSTKPSYAVIATQDRMINPELQRFMAHRAKSETVEVPASHAIFLSHPKEVAALIERAARAAE